MATTQLLLLLRSVAVVSGFDSGTTFRPRRQLLHWAFSPTSTSASTSTRPWSSLYFPQRRRSSSVGSSPTLRQSRLYHSSRTVATETETSNTTSSSRDSSSNNSNNNYKTKAPAQLKFSDTPLGQNGTHLLDGLDQYDVPSKYDGHPIAVYGIQSKSSSTIPSSVTTKKPTILLLHGRTWSSVPVYHLMGGSRSSNQEDSSRSLMEALLERGMQPYCMDFRGFGGTHPDETGYVEPNVCVSDTETVLQWIHSRHYQHNSEHEPPALLGWSQGALIAQLVSQRSTTVIPATTGCTAATTMEQPQQQQQQQQHQQYHQQHHHHHQRSLLSKVILYGSIYDPHVHYPREPLYRSTSPPMMMGSEMAMASLSSSHQLNTTKIPNHFDDAISDFTLEGTIPPEPARLFAEAALTSDPIKAVWRNLYQFNNCDPARVHVPCLVIAGDQDPYSSLHMQQELFLHLGRASDRTWSILSGSDHAVHLLDGGRDRLINIVTSFVMNGKRSEQ